VSQEGIVVIALAALAVITIAVAAVWIVPRIAPRRVIYETSPDLPCAFGYRMAWLAVRSRDARRVVEALGLTAVEPANWRTGVGVVYDPELAERRVFVSPPVNGWVFVVGMALPKAAGSGFADALTPLLTGLGQSFVEVQYYATAPDRDFHGWARLIDGTLVRAFAVSGEDIVLNTGRTTKDERALGLKLFELKGVKGRRGDTGGELILHPTEAHVMRLAGKWSIDPTTLGPQSGSPSLGTVGVAPRDWSAERIRTAA
jgi:hypothetical protein